MSASLATSSQSMLTYRAEHNKDSVQQQSCLQHVYVSRRLPGLWRLSDRHGDGDGGAGSPSDMTEQLDVSPAVIISVNQLF